MRYQALLAVSLVCAASFSASAAGITIRVPQDYPLIQEAVYWSMDGDTILVSPGRYNENVKILGRNIVLQSISPTDPDIVSSTVLYGTGSAAIEFSGAETSSCVIRGFTITGGQQVHHYGGGICGNGSHATIECNTIINNISKYLSEEEGGGGIADCHGLIQNNLIIGNVSTRGGGLFRCNGVVRNNVIARNTARVEGGGMYQCKGTIVNCIIWGNTAGYGNQLFDFAIPSYSCVQGFSAGGVGNLGLDPRFVGPNDYRLQPNSPCIDAGTNNNSPKFDMDGNRRPVDGNGDGISRPDMGAHEYAPAVTKAARHWREMR